MLRSKKYASISPPLLRSNDPPPPLQQLTDAVTTAHETSDTFSNETLREQATFQFAKEAEMKEMLSNLADGQIELYRNVSSHFISVFMFVYPGQAMEEWDRIIPIIQRIRVDV